jgi:prefoldin subunit 5
MAFVWLSFLQKHCAMQELTKGGPSKANNTSFWETEKMEYQNTINTLNQKMKDLSWVQSNFIRDPIFRIKCIIRLMQERNSDVMYMDSMLQCLNMSVKELDSSLKYLREMTALSGSKE